MGFDRLHSLVQIAPESSLILRDFSLHLWKHGHGPFISAT
jgi:hypothetical protein